MKWSVRRLNRVIRQMAAERYLEIGVSRGATFSQIDCERKVGVDPRMDVVSDAARTANATLYHLTSDQYFSNNYNEAFDVIFLDGLHTAEQTFRDFCNSLGCSHPGTVWLIDDVIPSSPFSALRSERRARQLRERLGVTEVAWHGDVFKSVLLIRMFLPSFTVRTIVGSGNPQSLVWFDPGASQGLNLDLYTLNSWDFFKLMEEQDAINPTTEEDAFDALSSWQASLCP